MLHDFLCRIVSSLYRVAPACLGVLSTTETYLPSLKSFVEEAGEIVKNWYKSTTIQQEARSINNYDLEHASSVV